MGFGRSIGPAAAGAADSIIIDVESGSVVVIEKHVERLALEEVSFHEEIVVA